jgi:hypothetical protein
VDFCAVGEVGVPLAAALRSEVQEVPDRSEQVDAALEELGAHPRMRSVEVAQGAIGVTDENGNGGVLTPFAVFVAQVVFEGAVAGAKEAQLVPAALSWDISGGDDCEIEILSEMMGHAVGAVEPGSTHRTSLGLLLTVHEVIDDEGAIGLGEEFAEADGVQGRVTSVEIARAFFKLIILNSGALRKMAAQLGDAFALAHELDFGEAKLLALP